MSELTAARRIVVKVGSALLVGPDGTAHTAWLADFAADVARFRARGQQVLIVSSGAVALGRRRLGLGGRTLSLPEKQASAAAGQSALMRAWEEALEPHACAQVLLTRDDTEVRRRWLNARATVETLLGLGVIPVINENDTVVTEEIRVGDNDRLSARVAQLVGAEALVLLHEDAPDAGLLRVAQDWEDMRIEGIKCATQVDPERVISGAGKRFDVIGQRMDARHIQRAVIHRAWADVGWDGG